MIEEPVVSAVQPSVLIVDDEPSIRDMLIQILQPRYIVYSATNATEAMRITQEHKPSLVIVDIYMPGVSGLQFCQWIRSEPITRDIPVIVMTARNAREIRVSAFDSGADDFLEKPFHMDELISRIDAKLRRFSAIANRGRTQVTFMDVTLDLERLVPSVDSKDLDLGQIEFKILSLLMRSPDMLVTRESVEQTVWGHDRPVTRSLDTHLVALRKQLSTSNQVVLRTVYGKGFVLSSKAPKR